MAGECCEGQAVGGNNGDLLICDREGTRCKATRTVRGSMEGKRRGAVRSGRRAAKDCRGRTADVCRRVLQRGARSGRLALRGSKVVWPVCDLQREWVGSKIIGEGRKAAKGSKRESGWRMSESAAKGSAERTNRFEGEQDWFGRFVVGSGNGCGTK